MMVKLAITIGAGLIIAATGWNFMATADIPSRFVGKIDFREFAQCNERDHERINDKLDKIFDTLMKHHLSSGTSDFSESFSNLQNR